MKLSTNMLGLVRGTFHLYFGGLLDASMSIFLGITKAINGPSYVKTQVDLSPCLHRGEDILIGNKYGFSNQVQTQFLTTLTITSIIPMIFVALSFDPYL